MDYFEEGDLVSNGSNMIIGIVTAVGVAVLIIIFISAMGAQTYNLVAPDIALITDAGIKTDVNGAIGAGFNTLSTTANYTQLLVLALIIAAVLGYIIGMSRATTYSGGAL